MSFPISTQQVKTPILGGHEPTALQTQDVQGQDGGRSVSKLIQQFEGETSKTPKSKGPPTGKPPEIVTRERSVRHATPPKDLQGSVSISKGPLTGPSTGPLTKPTTTPELNPLQKKHQDNIEKFGSKTANLDEMARIGVTVPGRNPVSTKEIFDHLLAQDKGNVIKTSWETMKQNGKIDDVNLKKITDKIEEIFDKPGGFPFTTEQRKWIEETMAGKVIIARSTGDEDSADTPNAGGNESVLFVEPNTASVSKAMKEVVLSYFGADSLRNRIVGDGMGTVLAGLPKMPVLLMEMIAEPIRDSGNQDVPTSPPIGIAMSTDKVEFTGGEDFHFVSISSAVGPGVNEGSGRIEIDETFVMQSSDGTPLLIYQQPSVKEERIRAVKEEGGKITHQLVKNSKEQAYSPSLSRDQVRDLVTSTDKIKGLNGGSTTEVEGVVGGSDKQINFVQHRPIPDSRSKVEPTYVNTKQSDVHAKAFSFTTVVPKSGDALVIDDWSQVCFAETMKEAEALFDWTGGKQKLVIVRQPDCSNSHPAVNFGSFKKTGDGGKKEPNPIPCLVVPNYGELLAMKKEALSSSRPLVIDGQTQKAFVWNDTSFSPDTAITKGRISHHIGLETGSTREGVEALVGKLKTTPGGQLGTLKGEMATVLKQYETEIGKLETLLEDKEDTIHNSEGLQIQLQTTKENFEAVKEAFAQLLAGNPKYDAVKDGTHARLLMVKFLEASLHAVDEFPQLIEAENSASKYLEAMKGSKLDNPTFGDQVGAVKDGLTGPLMMRWKRFLTLAEQSGLSKTEISDFKKMVEDLDKMGLTANWMSTVFDKQYAELLPPKDVIGNKSSAPHAKKLLQALVKDYQDTAPLLAKQQVFQKKLDEAERSIADFSSKSKYPKAFANLKELAETYVKQPWPKDLDKNPLLKAAHIKSLGHMIEVYDSSIKALKNSDFDTAELLEKELEMLETFKEMHKSLFLKTELPSGNHDPKTSYTLKLDQAYKTIQGQVSDQISKKETENLKAQSRCGKTFNVTNSLFNNRAKIMPSNVEELFTTLHQGLEDIRAGLMVSGGSNYDIDLPKEMLSVLSAIPQFSMMTPMGVPALLVGREITSTGVTYTHNLIVNDHGVKIKTSYEKPTPENPKGKTFIEIDFYADNMGGRLEKMAAVTNYFSPGAEVVWGDQQFKAKFEVGGEQDIQKLSVHLQRLIYLSVSMSKETLGRVVQSNAEPPSSGTLEKRRQRMMNDFLNVAFGIPPKTKTSKGAKPQTIPTTDFNVKFSYPKSKFTDKDTGKTYKLDLEKPNFGLGSKDFAKLPESVREEAHQAILDGPTKFSFKRDGKTYPIDLTKSDLGLTEGAIGKLGLNKKHLSSLRDDMMKALHTASVEVVGKGGSNLGGTWPEHLYGKSMAYTIRDTPPELTLWHVATSIADTPRSDKLKFVDDAFTATIHKKYALTEARQKLAEEGKSPTEKTIKEYHKALKEYHHELEKTALITQAYPLCESTSKSKVDQLARKTRIEKSGIETELQLQGIQPERLSLEEQVGLPMVMALPELMRAGKPVPKVVLERGESGPVTQDRIKTGEAITALNKKISSAMGSLTSPVDKDNYSMAMGILESSRHLMSESDLKNIGETWDKDPRKAIHQILHLELVSGVSDVDVISKPGGTKVGLSNGGADCFINSSLQLVAGMGGLSVPKDMPHLGKFLTGDLQTGGDCRNLRGELRSKAFQDVGEIRDAIVDGTAVSQQDAAVAVGLLLDKIKAPKLEFNKKFIRTEDGLERNGAPKSSSVLPLQLPKATGQLSLTGLFASNLTSQVEVGNWLGSDRNHHATEVLTLKDPAPDSAVISVGRFSYTALGGGQKRRDVVTGITSPVTMTDSSNNRVTYQPNSIICHIGAGVEGGHYITYRKEGADWLLFNDNNEVGVRVDLTTEPHKDRIERDSYVVGMAKVGVPYTPPTIPVDMEVIPVPVPLVRPLVTPSVTTVSTPITGSSSQVQSEPRTVTPSTVTPRTITPWTASKDLGIPTKNLETSNVLSSPTRPQTGIHEFHSKAFKAIFDKGITFPTPSGVKDGDRLTGKVTIEGKDYDVTATAKKAKGSGAAIWTVSLSTGGSSVPTEFVIKSNPMKLPDDSSVEMRDFAALDRQKNLREVQVLDHMSGNEHALQFHGAYSLSDGTLVYGMEKAQADMSEVLGKQVEARSRSSLIPTMVDKQLLEMSQALRDVHATGQVHGDVKPDNFMVGSDGSARIADFGECYMPNDTVKETTLKDDLQRFATMAFNLRNGLKATSHDLPTAIENQQKDIGPRFNTKILEMDSALMKEMSELERLNSSDPRIGELRQQRLDLTNPDKRLDTILQLSGGQLNDESVRSYLMNDLLLKTLQTPAPTFDTMNHVTTQLAKLVAQ